MTDVDPELVERVARWCADAGRQAGRAEIARALAPLGWDELLAVRALLADPPPARPLGPHALADIARGAPVDLAAERERQGRYRGDEDAEEPAPQPARAAPPRRAPARPKARGKSRGKSSGPVIHRARDRSPEAPARAPAELPRIENLRRPEGRGVLERLLRRHGARRAALIATLAAGWRGAGGRVPGDEDLTELLDHHGLARAFARRERDEVLHALRAAGGIRAAAAARLALDPAGLEAALVRLGAAEEADRIRGERRADLRARATLAERVRLLLAEEARLRDLGLLSEFEEDLRVRLPEHVRALQVGQAPLREALARSLSLELPAAEALARRFRLDLGPRAERPRGRGKPPGRRSPPQRPGREPPPRGGRAPARSRPAGRPPRGR